MPPKGKSAREDWVGPLKVDVGTSPQHRHSVEVTLSNHVDVDKDGVPVGFTHNKVARTAHPGDTLTLSYQDALSLIQAGYVTVDPSDKDAVAAILDG